MLIDYELGLLSARLATDTFHLVTAVDGYLVFTFLKRGLPCSRR